MAFAAFIGLIGTAFGSFLNVVAHRVPRGESVIVPPSHCPACAAAIRPRDNVPVLSWLLLHGRCRTCAAPISPRYPLIEALTGALCLGAVLAAGDTAEAALGIVLVLVLVPSAAIDLEYRIIPNQITATGAIVAVVVGLAFDPGGEVTRLICGLAAGGFLLVAALAYPAGMGMGDVKLAGVMGLCLGTAVAPAMLVALVAGVVYGVAMIARGAAGRRTAIPFGPFLALGGVVGICAGPSLVHLYLGSIGR
ncbi:MAG TPA: prepilin peptidase [Solirubrobacteraceae bacterium]|nr:prepilin peptidase [Solirubrobacteraceae bacterium]